MALVAVATTHPSNPKDNKMTDFTIHTHDTAPAASKPRLDVAVNAFGMVPNLIGVLAESPETLEAYQTLHSLFEKSSLSTTEKNVVWLTINVEHNCHYCVPAHTAIAHMQKVDAGVIDALRNAAPLPDAKLEALRQFTLKVVRQRGEVSDAEVATFLAAGFTKRNVLDVLIGVSQKVISNYTNHLAHTPVDAPFRKFDWTPAQVAAE